MYQSVQDAFFKFTVQFEGKLPCMYLDVKHYVTTGVGNLIDPVGAALNLPWQKKGPDGELVAASPEDIHAEWGYVKSRTDLAPKGGSIFLGVTKLRLTDDAIAKLVLSKLQSNEAALKPRYPTYETWPADAQLGLHSMAWAMGPYFHWPKFMAALNKQVPDFAAAAKECVIVDPGNPIGGRNKANALLFNNADLTQKWGLDYATMKYPTDLSATTQPTPCSNA